MIIKNLLVSRFTYVPVVLYTGLIAWLSLARFAYPVDINVEGSDKIGHMLAYLVLTILWFLFFFFSEKQKKTFNRSLLWASVFCFLYGLVMELLQMLLTNHRMAEWYDVLANTSGIIFAVIVLWLIKGRLQLYRN